MWPAIQRRSADRTPGPSSRSNHVDRLAQSRELTTRAQAPERRRVVRFGFDVVGDHHEELGPLVEAQAESAYLHLDRGRSIKRLARRGGWRLRVTARPEHPYLAEQLVNGEAEGLKLFLFQPEKRGLAFILNDQPKPSVPRSADRIGFQTRYDVEIVAFRWHR